MSNPFWRSSNTENLNSTNVNSSNSTTYFLVTGSRKWIDRNLIRKELEIVKSRFPDITLVHGGCRGADLIAGSIWKELGGVVVSCPADWTRYGKAAGLIRNESMINDFNVEFAVAFVKGESRGTLHMVSLLKKKEISVRIIES